MLSSTPRSCYPTGRLGGRQLVCRSITPTIRGGRGLCSREQHPLLSQPLLRATPASASIWHFFAPQHRAPATSVGWRGAPLSRISACRGRPYAACLSRAAQAVAPRRAVAWTALTTPLPRAALPAALSYRAPAPPMPSVVERCGACAYNAHLFLPAYPFAWRASPTHVSTSTHTPYNVSRMPQRTYVREGRDEEGGRGAFPAPELSRRTH